MGKPTREQILADPSSYNVDDVTAALEGATRDEIDAAKASEAAGKQRVGILEFTSAAPEVEEPRYVRSRIVDVSEGPLIVGHIDALGRTATLPDIVGALDGVEGETFTRVEVRDHIAAFLARPVEA